VHAPADESSWIGMAPGEDDGGATDAAFGSSVPLEDLLSDAPQRPISVAPDVRVRDHESEPDWSRVEARDDTPAVAHPPRAGAGLAPKPEGDDVLLTEVASDDDLFSDPSLEVAHMAAGETREILVPLMLGEGIAARRFKLAIRLRLDPVE
jgi:hypothetical protein